MVETEKPTIEQVIQMAKGASRTIIESGQKHQPMLIIFTPTEVVSTLLTWVKKENFKDVVSQLLRHLHAHAYIFINEGWVTKLDKDSPLTQELLSGRKKVSELPPDDKTEILTVMVAENNKSCRMWSAKIQYTRDDKRYLGEWEEAAKVGEGRIILKEW